MRLNYRQIADDLASRIASRDKTLLRLPDANRLPSYKDLAGEYEVSVSTILRALSLLHERQVIYGEPGRGVYVREEST